MDLFFNSPQPNETMLEFSMLEMEDSTTSARNHSQAEKRRRDRINTHLSTLRKLLPTSEKMDKASLLASVIDRVKDLKKKAMGAREVVLCPSEVDELIISDYECELKENIFIRVSLCCEDRPQLFPEMVNAFAGLGLEPVRVDITCLGERIRCLLILSVRNNEAGSIESLKDSLQVVLHRIAVLSTSSSRVSSKRQRFFLSSSQ